MRPNVLLVTVDSLRADHVSCCTEEAPVETPGIDAVAEGGTAFTDAFAQGPFTTFSMPSLFTSRYPSGLRYLEFPGGVVGVYPGNEPTVAEVLGRAGYETAGFHSNPLLSSLFGFDRGFETFDADLPLSGLDLPGRLALIATKLRRLVRRHAYLPAPALTRRAREWVEGRAGDRPFFLWAHYMDVHGPYQRTSGLAYLEKYRAERRWRKAVHSPAAVTPAEHEALVTAYRDEVRDTDERLGRLVSAVEVASRRPTIVVVTADHGEGFGEHGYYSHPHEVHDALVRVPLVIRDPTGTVEPGRVAYPVELLDVAPTLLDAAGEESPETFEGQSLRGARERSSDGARERSTDGARERPLAITEAELVPGYRAAFVTERWKYVVDEEAGEERLFDRRTGDGADASDEESERLEALRRLAEAHREREAASPEGEAASADLEGSDVRARLKELGYLE